MVDGLVEAGVEGTPQGGPLSPLLANIYLDALDKELERRGHGFCRYADDCNVYVSSQSAADRTLASLTGWIEKHLRLKVNAVKSGTGRIEERKFLGFRLDRRKRIGIAPESVERFRNRVRELWDAMRSRTSNSCETTGTSTCEAGGATSGWPKRGRPFANWKHGSAATYESASG
jgi:hypothetical protein